MLSKAVSTKVHVEIVADVVERSLKLRKYDDLEGRIFGRSILPQHPKLFHYILAFRATNYPIYTILRVVMGISPDSRLFKRLREIDIKTGLEKLQLIKSI